MNRRGRRDRKRGHSVPLVIGADGSGDEEAMRILRPAKAMSTAFPFNTGSTYAGDDADGYHGFLRMITFAYVLSGGRSVVVGDDGSRFELHPTLIEAALEALDGARIPQGVVSLLTPEMCMILSSPAVGAFL